MAKEVQSTIKCQKCGRTYQVTRPGFIDVSKNPELRKKVLYGDIAETECPYCQHKQMDFYPINYCDPKKRFFIQSGSSGFLMNRYENERKENNDGKSLVNLKNFRYVGATSHFDMISKIAMLENNIDYRLGTIYQIFGKAQMRKLYKERNGTEIQIEESFYGYEDGKFIIEIFYKDEEGKSMNCTMIFSQEEYDKVVECYSKHIDEVYSFFFDREAAKKYMMEKEFQIIFLKFSKVELATVSFEKGYVSPAYIPSCNKGKYKIGDKVCIMKNNTLWQGEIANILEFNEYSLPSYLKDTPAVAFKARDFELSFSPDSNEELHNEDFAKSIMCVGEDLKFNELIA